MLAELLAYAYAHGPIIAVICTVTCLVVIWIGFCINSHVHPESDITDDYEYLTQGD